MIDGYTISERTILETIRTLSPEAAAEVIAEAVSEAVQLARSEAAEKSYSNIYDDPGANPQQ